MGISQRSQSHRNGNSRGQHTARAMPPDRQALLPGFERPSWRSVLSGLIENYGHGWNIARVCEPVRNVFTVPRNADKGRGLERGRP